jgi:hypothetical protein
MGHRPSCNELGFELLEGSRESSVRIFFALAPRLPRKLV